MSLFSKNQKKKKKIKEVYENIIYFFIITLMRDK